MKPKSKQKVTPDPYYRITFGCTNRLFYNVKSEIYQLGRDIGINPQNGYMDEFCDYEGDLERIKIYRSERNEEFIQELLRFYGVDEDDARGLDIVFSCF